MRLSLGHLEKLRSRKKMGQHEKQRVRQISKRRLWTFRAIVILLPFCAIALVNSILYWAGIGVDTSFVVSNDRIGEGRCYLNPVCDVVYCNSDLRGPEPQVFGVPKSANTFRIVVVGASSVQGYPHPSELAFPRQMELILERQLPERDVEVLNAGVVGLSTTPLVDLVSQVIEVSPDLIVLYAGHNEFYGVGGVATNAQMTQLGVRFRRFRLGQWLTRHSDVDDTSKELITRLPIDVAIPIDSELVARAEGRYKNNLDAIAEVCSRNDVPLLLCTVVSNLRDHSPLQAPYSPGLSDADRERANDLESQAIQLMNRERYAEAIEPLLACSDLLPNRAETAYWLAQCLDHVGRKRDATSRYTSARDLDGCRYRAPSSFRRIAGEVAANRRNSGVHLVDLVPEFAQASEHVAPGHELFLEHVHFTFEGHWLAAKVLARTIVEDACGETWNEGAVPSTEERDAWVGVIIEDHIVATTLASFLLERPPFDKSVDVKRHLHSLTSQIERFSESLSRRERQVYESLHPKTKMDDLVDGLGRVYLAEGDLEIALAYFQRGKRRRPWMPNSFVFAGICHHLLGDDEQAIENMRSSLHTSMAETEPLLIDRNEILKRIGVSASQLK